MMCKTIIIKITRRYAGNYPKIFACPKRRKERTKNFLFASCFTERLLFGKDTDRGKNPGDLSMSDFDVFRDLHQSSLLNTKQI